MHWIRFAILVFVVMLLQTGLVDVMAITDAQIKPDLMLILLVFFASQSNPMDAMISSFIIGLATDIITVAVGPHMIAFGVLGTVVSELRRFIVLRHALGLALATLAVGILAALFVVPLAQLKGQPLHPSLWWEPLYSALLAPLFSFSLPWIMGWQHRRRSAEPH